MSVEGRRLTLDELQEAARLLTRDALRGWRIADDDRPHLTLGTFWEDEGQTVVFSLYLSGERPLDARYLTRAALDRSSGEGSVEIFTEHLQPVPGDDL